MRSSTLIAALASLAASTLAFTVTSPSTSSYWVQFSTNTVSWSTSSGDPTSVSLQIINANRTILNGVFSIAEYVKASLESFTITNVTLVVGDGYIVQMVNPLNNTDVYASSGAFSVKSSGTPAAPTTSSSGGQSGTSSTGNTTAGTAGTTTASGNNGTSGRNFTGSSNSTAGSNARANSASTSAPAAGLLMASMAAISFVAL